MSTTQASTFGAEIKSAIEETGISFAEVARRMDVSRQAVNRLDTRKTFNLDFLQKLKKATGLDYTNYVFNPKKAKYEPYTELTVAAEAISEYQRSQVTLTLNVGCPRDRVGEFSKFLTDVELVADKYGFQII